MHWPLPLHLGRDIAQDLGDPLVQAWQIAWDGHALKTQPLGLFQANMFWPLPDSLAFSDALVGYAPAGLVGEGVHAAVARYDLLFLFAYALCFVGAYVLARELGANQAGAIVAGAAFAYAPWRLEQEGHLHIISSGAIPLALFLLLRGYRRRARRRSSRAGSSPPGSSRSASRSACRSRTCSLAARPPSRSGGWRRGTAAGLPRNVLLATAAGMLCFALVAGLLARPYLRVLDDHPEGHRSIATVAHYSGPPYEFLVASEDSRVWGAATQAAARPPHRGPREDALPRPRDPRARDPRAAQRRRCRATSRRRLGWGALAFAVLSLGVQLNGVSWLYPYRWLYEVLPGWQGIRVPGPAAHAHDALPRAARRRRRAGARQPRPSERGGAREAAPGRRSARTEGAKSGAGAALGEGAGARKGAIAATATAALLCVAILAEGWGFADHPTVETRAAGYAQAPQPALHLPTGRLRQPPLRPVVDRRLPEDRQRPRQPHPAPVRGRHANHAGPSRTSAR